MAKKNGLDGIQKAAVLLIALGPDMSSQIFKHLHDDEIEQLTLEIANTNSVSPGTKEEVLNEFYEVCPVHQQSSVASVVALSYLKLKLSWQPGLNTCIP